ncbi:thioesterase II family protein [Chitinophaga sp. Hz27]|uniref:thioesterase II family protein n=1 Tax=Chitinophaga sp. Hz27 TaxID=3347169 RepID=UPI0035E3445E
MKKMQLFLLHFAGGNCYSFQFLQPYLSEVTFTPLELPGRGKRYGESLLWDIDEATADIIQQINEKLVSENYVIYGHSLGALLTLKAAAMMEKNKRPAQHLVVSGNAGPDMRVKRQRHLMTRGPLKEELKRLGGVPEEFLVNEELFDFYEPILRADFALAEQDSVDSYEQVNTPLHAIMGEGEEDSKYIGNWAAFTESFTGATLLPGGHFFIHDYPREVAGIIKQCCRIQAF